MSQIINLASPQTLHSFEVKRLKAQHIELIGEFMCQFPEPVPSTVGDFFVLTHEVFSCSFTTT